MNTKSRPLGVLLLRGCGLVLLVLGIVGCGGTSKGTVTGKVVTDDGKPLPGGSIIFIDGDKKYESGIGGTGEYSVTGVPTGKYKVVVDNSKIEMMMQRGGMGGPPSTGPQLTPEQMKGMKDNSKFDPEKLKGMEGAGGDRGKMSFVAIDKKYTSASTTPLEHTVKRGEAKDVEFKVDRAKAP